MPSKRDTLTAAVIVIRPIDFVFKKGLPLSLLNRVLRLPLPSLTFPLRASWTDSETEGGAQAEESIVEAICIKSYTSPTIRFVGDATS
uniref:Aspartate aminotransferase n=1 Tax=Rhizophora mucronata TaxID=61149 RepID=A0A2P2L9G5_RHIMU